MYINIFHSVAHHIFHLEKVAHGKDKVEHHWSRAFLRSW